MHLKTKVVHLISLAGLVVTLAGCGRRGDRPSGTQIERAVNSGELAELEAPRLPLKITKVYSNQRVSATAPWHTNGSGAGTTQEKPTTASTDWTFLDCELTTDPLTKVTMGIRALQPAKGQLPVAFGEVVLGVPNRESGARFVEAFAAAFGQSAPPSPAQSASATSATKPALHLTGNLAITGSDLVPAAGGGFTLPPRKLFSSSKGTWTATKLFLGGDSSNESEVYFNYSTAEMRAEFTEKDEDYREALIQELAIALRDGPLPERTPENDPILTTTGPHVVNWQRIANKGVSAEFSTDGAQIIFAEDTNFAKGKLLVAPISNPDARKQWADFEGMSGVIGQAVTSAGLELLVLESIHKDPHIISSDDPQRAWIVDAAGKQEVGVAFGMGKSWLVWPNSLSPDGRYVAVESWQNAKGNPASRARSIYVKDLQGGSWRTFELKATMLELVRWTHTADGRLFAIARTGSKYEPKAEHRLFRLDPRSGELAPLADWPGAKLGEIISSDERRVAALHEKKSLTITDVATSRTSEFVFHPYDRRSLFDGSIAWVDGRYLTFATARPALIDSDSMKMSYPTAATDELQELKFSSNLRFALGTKADGVYLGKVENP